MSLIRWPRLDDPADSPYKFFIRGKIYNQNALCPTCEAEIVHTYLIGGNQRRLDPILDNCPDCLGTNLHPCPSTEL